MFTWVRVTISVCVWMEYEGDWQRGLYGFVKETFRCWDSQGVTTSEDGSTKKICSKNWCQVNMTAVFRTNTFCWWQCFWFVSFNLKHICHLSLFVSLLTLSVSTHSFSSSCICLIILFLLLSRLRAFSNFTPFLLLTLSRSNFFSASILLFHYFFPSLSCFT